MLRIQINDIFKILQLENEQGYYQVCCRTDTGYINRVIIVHIIKSQNPEYKKDIEKARAYNASRINEIPKYISLYGEPSKTSEFSSGDYVSKTLIWYCVQGKYR